jgi:branched-chain amino acid aminotransferase
VASQPPGHRHADDPRNAELIVSVNGQLVERADAVVSVFDSGFVLGDGVWEGLRLWGGHPAFLEAHLDRLWEGAAAIVLDIGLTRAELTAQIYRTLAANEMTGDGVHVRLMVTRGVRASPYQHPRLSAGAATVVIIARHDQPDEELMGRGLSLFTVHVRRASPDTLDPKLNSHSKLTDVLACIQAEAAGADEALMLDPLGFVSTCNSTHFFIVRRGEVWTSTGEYCLAGVTRRNVLRVCADAGIPAYERRFSLTDVYGAEEAFVTGTLAGIVPVHTIDGRTVGVGRRGPVVERLQLLYEDLAREDVAGRVSPLA